MGTKWLTAEQERLIVESYQRTRVTTATAKEIGVSTHQVKIALRKNNVPLTRSHESSACYLNQDVIRRMAADGASLSVIADHVGTNRRHVSRFLKDHGIDKEPFRQTMENNPAWRGGRHIDADGYVLVKAPDHPNADRHGYMREHRLVMERVLGRYLLPSEVVHHKQEPKTNNDPSNLVVYGSNAEHLSETLAGQVPQWTSEGKAKILESVRRPRSKKRDAIRPDATRDDPSSPDTSDQTTT